MYLGLSVLCALFGGVYECFSHQVYSYFMLYAFLIPLVGGACPFFALALSRRAAPGRPARNLYHSGLAAWTVGCLFRGALDIYGTTNHLINLYWIAGAALLALGILLYLLPMRTSGRPSSQ